MRTTKFEFHAYAGDDTGRVASTPTITTERLRDINAARGKAGRLAKSGNGPVDLAYAGNTGWEHRYITTAAPSPHHASGYRFERLD